MKRIEAIIRPYKWNEVRAALGDRVDWVFVEEVRGFGRQYGHSEIYRGAEYKVDFVPKLRLEIYCRDAETEWLCDLISDSARSGRIGDGKIFLTGGVQVFDLATGEQEDADYAVEAAIRTASA